MSSVPAVAPCRARAGFDGTTGPRRKGLAEDLSRCDWAIVRTVERVGLATGQQLEHLHFHALPDGRPDTPCQRTLQRLVDLGVLATSDPSVSNYGDGDLAAPTYSLGSTGPLLIGVHADSQTQASKSQRPGEPRTTHALAVTQLFVDLVEHDRMGDLRLEAFRTGPVSHWPDGSGQMLEPDAFIRVARDGATDFWWLEVDREQNSTASMLAKARAYLDFRKREERGPDGVMPRVLIGALTKARAGALQFMLGGLPEGARQMFFVTYIPDAVDVITKELKR
jgi:hypothetical protein